MHGCFLSLLFGTPDAIRTHDLQSRSLTLYPAELRAHITPQMRGCFAIPFWDSSNIIYLLLRFVHKVHVFIIAANTVDAAVLRKLDDAVCYGLRELVVMT